MSGWGIINENVFLGLKVTLVGGQIVQNGQCSWRFGVARLRSGSSLCAVDGFSELGEKRLSCAGDGTDGS